jgi:hypothetical protein
MFKKVLKFSSVVSIAGGAGLYYRGTLDLSILSIYY